MRLARALRPAGSVPPARLPAADTESLVALGTAIAEREMLTYLELNSRRADVADLLVERARCRRAALVAGRPEAALTPAAGNPGGAVTVYATAAEVPTASARASLCLVRASEDGAGTLQNARFCLSAVHGCGVIVFEDRTRVNRGIRCFLSELDECRAYPLTTELFVVEVGVRTLLADPVVRSRVPRREWLRVSGSRRRVTAALALTGGLRGAGVAAGAMLLRCGSGGRARSAGEVRRKVDGLRPFTVHTFVNDEGQYESMRESYQAAGFDPGGFVRHTDTSDDPYRAITRLGMSPDSEYPILCHQDTRPDRGAGADDLWQLLTDLSDRDPAWVVAGAAGVTATGEIIRRYVNPSGPVTEESTAHPVQSLDECFLVFNARNVARCSKALIGFHLYGTDACLQAGLHGGSAYVLSFPITHLSDGTVDASYRDAEARLREAWSPHHLFRYVVSPVGAVFISRSPLLNRIFGSPLAMACVRLRVQAQR